LGDINFLCLVWSDGDLVCRGQGDPFFVEKLHSGRCQSERESQVEVMSILWLASFAFGCANLCGKLNVVNWGEGLITEACIG
jgi:hypothetical protein